MGFYQHFSGGISEALSNSSEGLFTESSILGDTWQTNIVIGAVLWEHLT